MSSYPVLVERWDDKHPADLAICTECHAEMTWNPEEGDPYDLCIRHQVPKTAGGTDFCGQIVMKYDQGVRCGGCGKLDYRLPLDTYCSRVCQLQAEYAATLATNQTEPRGGDS